MILIISLPDKSPAGEEIGKIFFTLRKLDVDILKNIKKIILFQSFIDETLIDELKCLKPEEIFFGRPYSKRNFEGKDEKTKLIMKIFRSIQAETFNNMAAEAFIKRIKEKEICFIYPLFSIDMIPLLQLTDKINFYIDLTSSGSAVFNSIYKVISIGMFCEILQRLDIIDYNFLSTLLSPDTFDYIEIKKGSIPHPGSFIIDQLRDDDDEFPRRILFMGFSQKLVSVSIDYLLKELEVAQQVFCHDLTEGLPKNILRGFDVLIFLNADSLSWQEQSSLLTIISVYDYNNANIYIHSMENNVSPYLASSFSIVEKPTFEKMDYLTSEYFLSYFYTYGSKKNKEISLSGEILDFNLFGYLLYLVRDNFELIPEIIESFPEVSSYETLFSVEFWYALVLQAEIVKNNYEEKRRIRHNNYKEYKWLYRGDYWEISYGYEEPMLLESAIGVFYIAHLMALSGRKIDADKLRETIRNKSLSIKSRFGSVPPVRKEINKVINKIESLEKQMNLNNDLSVYLKKAFFPKSLLPESGMKNEYSDYFSDTNNTCMCILPDEPKVKWQISTPVMRSEA